jgi:hypothetical protein
MAGLCAACDLVISAVTASNTLAVAREAAQHMRPGTVFLDLNSASPGTKQAGAALIDGAGAVYVEAGVMTSVPPYGIRVPMLLGGARAAELAPVLPAGAWTPGRVRPPGRGQRDQDVPQRDDQGPGGAGDRELRHRAPYGVEDHMIPTLEETFPSIDWQKQGAYFFSRVVQHGQRRAEEMREAANTVREAGFEPFMAARDCRQAAVGGRPGPGRHLRRRRAGRDPGRPMPIRCSRGAPARAEHLSAPRQVAPGPGRQREPEHRDQHRRAYQPADAPLGAARRPAAAGRSWSPGCPSAPPRHSRAPGSGCHGTGTESAQRPSRRPART